MVAKELKLSLTKEGAQKLHAELEALPHSVIRRSTHFMEMLQKLEKMLGEPDWK